MIRKELLRADFVLIRTPTLALDVVDVLRDSPSPDAAVDLLGTEEAKLVRQAMQIASPGSLAAERISRDKRVMERTLYRMATRATPFGLHAACSIGTMGRRTEIALASHAKMLVYCVSNFQALVAADRALHPPGKNTSLLLNPTARQRPNGYTFVSRSRRGYEYVWGTLARSAIADLVWGWSGGDRRSLVSDLMSELIMEEAEAEARVEELVAVDFVRTGPARVCVTGQHESEILPTRWRKSSLIPWNEFDPEAESSKMRRLFARTRVGPPPDAGLHAVLWRDGEKCVVGNEDLNRLEGATEALYELGMARGSKISDALFDQFTHRFGYESVPLLDVVDPSSGLEALLWGNDQGKDMRVGGSTPEALPIHQALAGQLGRSEVVISDGLIGQCRTRPDKPLPDSLLIHAELWARGGRIVPALMNASGPPGTALLGRFASALPSFEHQLRRYCELEDRGVPGATLEVFHVPFPGVGNVATRPMCRAYAIGVDGEYPGIDVRTLELCVGDGEFILWSRELGRLHPRTTTAMVADFKAATSPIYKILAMIQAHGVLGYLAWDWGPLRKALSLPRIVYRGAVLAPRQWYLSKRTWQADLRRHFEAGLPRLVKVDEAKGPLTIDTQNPRSLEDLARIVGKQGDATLTELGPPESTGSAKHKGRHHLTEILVPYRRNTTAQVDVEPTAAPLREPPAPNHLPGARYLTLKLYAGLRELDTLVTRAPVLLLSRLQAHEIQHWHFLRFGDPEPHLRIRICGNFQHLRFGELNAVLEQLREDCGDLKASIDGYTPEFGRYGGAELMGLAERIFFVDSVAAVAVLSSQALVEGRREREYAMLKVTERLIDCLVPSGERVCLCESLLAHYGGRQAATLAKREARKALSSWAHDWQNTEVRGLRLTPVSRALDARDRAARDYGLALQEQIGNGEYRRLCAGSIVHMQINRYLEDGDRSKELLVYELVRRLFRRSEISERAGPT